MGLSLQEALDSDKLTIDEQNSLTPQIISAILTMEGADPGKTVGSWEIIEDMHGKKGFATEIPPIFSTFPVHALILQEEPFLISVMAESNDQFLAHVSFDFRKRRPDPKKDMETSADNSDEELKKSMSIVVATTILWILNHDLFTFLAGDGVVSHQQRVADIKQDLQME